MATLAPSPVPVARRPPKGSALLRVLATTDHKLIVLSGLPVGLVALVALWARRGHTG